MRQTTRRPSLRTGFTVAFALCFLLFSGLALRDLYRAAREREANEILVRQAEQTVSRPDPGSMPEYGASGSLQEPQTAPERDYRPLLQDNPDLAAWLIVRGIEADYPVMYTPEEPEHYLRRAFDGGYALSGSLFIGADCVPDGTNIIIYGHNMKDGSMFGRLDAYADEDYAREHQEISYDLIQPDGSYKRLTFEVMAAFYGRIYNVEEENVFRYYYASDLSDPGDFQYYVEQTMASSLYDLGVTAEYGDRLLTLSTCSYHTENGRFVVVAREEHSSSSMQ